MELKQTLFNTEEVSYTSNLTVAGLKQRIERLFEQRTLPIAGKLISAHEFTAYDKWTVIGWSMPNLRRKAAYIKGEITPEEKGTLIRLQVNPNSILPVFAVLAALIGAIVTLASLSNIQDNLVFIFFGLALVVLGMIYYPISTVLRNRLRNRMVKYLDLKKM